MVRALDGGVRLRGQRARIAGAEADHRQLPARRADRRGVDRGRRAGDRAGSALRSGLLDDQFRFRPRRREGRAFRHPVAADRAEHDVRGVAEARPFRLQGGGGEEPGRDAERAGEGMDRGFVRLEVDREHPGYRVGGEPGPVQARAGEGRDLLRLRAPLAADAEREPARAVDEGIRRPLVAARAAAAARDVDPDRELPRVVERKPALREPRRPRSQVRGRPHPRPREQGGGEGLAVLGVRERPAGGRRVEGEAEAAVAGGGDCGGGADPARDAAGQVHPAAVPSEERDHERPVLGDRDDRRLGALVVEGRRDRAHQDPGRADPDDGAAVLEQGAEMRAGLREPDVRAARAPPEPVHLRLRLRLRAAGDGRPLEDRGDPARERTAALGDRDHRDPPAQRHARPRRCTRTIEK